MRNAKRPVSATICLQMVVILAVTLLLTGINTLPSRASATASSYEVAEGLFKGIWNRADGPILAKQPGTDRSWLWGPGPFTAFNESYGAQYSTRFVMYFDKARMEQTHPDSKQVTNGLLVVEMLSGKVQLGDNRFGEPGGYEGVKEGPADINIVGDPGNWLTYARLSPYASLNLDNRAVDRTGQTVDDLLTETNGIVRAEQAGKQLLAFYEPTLGHNVPGVFWDFLNQSGLVYQPGSNSYITGKPINWLTDVGYPVTEPYWVRQKVGGVEKDILFQAFQRRTLTYTPTNPPVYQVEMGNVGRQYIKWRYGYDFGPNMNWSAPGTDGPLAVSHAGKIVYQGTQEAYFDGKYNTDPESNYIYLINPDGTNRTLVTEGKSPLFSPDGKRLSYYTKAPPPLDPNLPDWDIDVNSINLDGSGLQKITRMAGNARILLERWSPRNRYIAFSGTQQVGPGGVQLINISSGEIGSFPGSGQLDWTPDGENAIWQVAPKDDYTGYNLVYGDPDRASDRGAFTAVTHDQYRYTFFDMRFYFSSRISPDGKTIAIAGSKIFFESIPGKTSSYAGKVLDSVQPGARLAWSPDGKALAVVDWSSSLYLFEIESGQITKLAVGVSASSVDWTRP